MSKPASPQMVRSLVDFYQGGKLLYKSGLLYPSDTRLELLKLRGEAEDFKPVESPKTGKRSKSAEPAAQVPASSDLAAAATDQQQPVNAAGDGGAGAAEEDSANKQPPATDASQVAASGDGTDNAQGKQV